MSTQKPAYVPAAVISLALATFASTTGCAPSHEYRVNPTHLTYAQTQPEPEDGDAEAVAIPALREDDSLTAVRVDRVRQVPPSTDPSPWVVVSDKGNRGHQRYQRGWVMVGGGVAVVGLGGTFIRNGNRIANQEPVFLGLFEAATALVYYTLGASTAAGGVMLGIAGLSEVNNGAEMRDAEVVGPSEGLPTQVGEPLPAPRGLSLSFSF